MTDAIEQAHKTLSDGFAVEASWPLLARWRETRDPALADVLDRLLVLQVERDEVPIPIPETREDNTWQFMQSHPYLRADPPDPRASFPIIASAFSAGQYNPYWPTRVIGRLIAHGDPRSVAWLDLVLGDELATERAAFAQMLPRVLPLSADERGSLDALRGAIDALQPDATRGLPFERYGRLEVRRAVHFVSQLGDLGLLVASPIFVGASISGLHIRARARVLDAVRRHARLPALRTIELFGDEFWRARDRPAHYPPSWDGARARRAAVELLQLPVLRGLESVGPLPLQLVRELGDAGLVAPSLRVLRLAVASDTDTASAWATELPRLQLPALTTIASLPESPELLVEALAALPPTVDTIDTGGALRTLDAWLAAIPATVRHLVLTQRQWTLRLAREVSGAPWSLEATLGPEWDRFESLVEDPPTPGADLVYWLERAAPDLLGELLVPDRGELDSDEPIIAAARRQQRLRSLRLADPDTGVIRAIT